MSNKVYAECELIRAAIYGRFSTNMQRLASLEDQERSCRGVATDKGWEVLDHHIYTDAAKSGTMLAKRPGLDALVAAAKLSPRLFDCIIIDDTSRLSRNLGDFLKLEQQFRRYGVGLYFVQQKLDSMDPNFRLMATVYGMADEQTITRTSKKSREGVIGRVLAGYNGGSAPYGYRGVRERSDLKGAFGQAASKGTRLEIIENEAMVVRRVMRDFVDGRSAFQISKRLNGEDIPWPHHRSGKWGADTVKRLLHNEKYKGVNTWNLTSQKKDLDTGQVIKRATPESEHIRVPAPELRIVSDELWESVQERLKLFSDKQNARRLAGWNRAKVNQYPFSGLLVCGLCHSRMRVEGKQNKSIYKCPNNRNSLGCANKLKVREKIATAQITDALASQLLVPETMKYLVGAVARELKEAVDRQKKSSPSGGLKELEDARRALHGKIENIIGVVESTGSSALSNRLTELELEKRRIDRQLSAMRAAVKGAITEADLKAQVGKNVKRLQDILRSDASVARQILQRHIKALYLFPDEVDGAKIFQVVGELDLFAEPDDQTGRQLLEVLGTQNLQQLNVDRTLCFIFQLYPETKDCLHLELFCRLLEKNPALSLRSLEPSEWALLLQNFLPGDETGQQKLGYGAIARCFWNHREQLETKLSVIKSRNPKNMGHVYQLALIDDSRSIACADLSNSET